ncbi:hypothetical protein [Planomonospora venezuelensis]|uniref:Ig-like domain-containing protein n=1 Tax=Planomonospora venezuelensis TaxID=1999 RepID=A0A841CZ51_PLAVE|nr:hypothetical protein [Planomonospora venezuelensis]MBB5962740.1 hypothetical protein [Planomonospora venezuelensis]
MGAGAAMLATMATGLLATPAAAASGSTQAGKSTSSAAPKASVFAGTPKASYKGDDCPVRVTFSSNIKVKAVKGKTTVAYRWLHGDGSKSKVKTFTVGKGVKNVTVKETTTFKSDVKGWQALQVLAPRKATSKKGYFKVSCGDHNGGKEEIRPVIGADAWVDEGNCQAALIGRITASVPALVRYRWVVNGHVVDYGAVKVSGSRKVVHVIRPGKDLRGWAALQIVDPVSTGSGRVGFKIWCKDWSPKVTASVHSLADYEGSCPVDRAFTGTISASHGRGHVKYRWIRNGVAGAWESVYVHGSTTVRDPWRATDSGTASRAIELYHGSTTGTVTSKVTCKAPVTASVDLSVAQDTSTCGGVVGKASARVTGTITVSGASELVYSYTSGGVPTKVTKTVGAGGGTFSLNELVVEAKGAFTVSVSSPQSVSKTVSWDYSCPTA